MYIELALAVFFFLIQITPVIARVVCRGSWAVKLEMGEEESLRDKGIVKVVKVFQLFAASASLDPPPHLRDWHPPISGIDPERADASTKSFSLLLV